jgi:hypothetical protein
MRGPSFAKQWRMNIFLNGDNQLDAVRRLCDEIVILKHLRRNASTLGCFRCHFDLSNAHFLFFFNRMVVDGLDRISNVATASARDSPVPIAKVLPLPLSFNTATPCGRFWIDDRLPGPSNVHPFPRLLVRG